MNGSALPFWYGISAAARFDLEWLNPRCASREDMDAACREAGLELRGPFTSRRLAYSAFDDERQARKTPHEYKRIEGGVGICASTCLHPEHDGPDPKKIAAKLSGPQRAALRWYARPFSKRPAPWPRRSSRHRLFADKLVAGGEGLALAELTPLGTEVLQAVEAEDAAILQKAAAGGTP